MATEPQATSFALAWGLPFAGLLLSIATLPLLAPAFWHHHMGKVALAWGLAFVLPFSVVFGAVTAAALVAHVVAVEYVPFIVVLFALYTVAGGICVLGNLPGTPGWNTALLALGTVLASIMGTTGASMLLIRPVIRANDNRRHKAHVIVFFIFLVANAGGSLSPLGDPPLFLGFLKGVEFFWVTSALLPPMLALCSFLLAVFYVLDRRYHIKAGEDLPRRSDPTPDVPLRLVGGLNFWLLAGIVAAVLLSAVWKPGLALRVLATDVELQNLVRDAVLIVIALVSLRVTPKVAREGNAFSWAPIAEVAKLFLGIFVTIAPVIEILHAGKAGALGGLVSLVQSPDGTPIHSAYFWMTGGLSAFLDNAPTYLVFFNLAGGDATALMQEHATLRAISAGAVFMGALTYIGNAPNFMVKAIAEERGIVMPSFVGYLAWSAAVMLPAFIGLTVMFFR